MANAWHVEWLKEGVKRWNKRRKRVFFEPDLSGVNFFELLPSDFRDDPKTSRYFERINLSAANLAQADLSRLNFFRANFDGSNLEQAELTRSNFEEVSFRRANLRGVNFENSRLARAEFEELSVENTSFLGAEIDDAVFISVELSGSQREEIGADRIREFASRVEYRDEERSYRLSGTGVFGGAAQPEAERPRKNQYEVFFGTTRKPIYERGALVDFGAEQWSKTNYGIAEVVVPDGNRMGGIGKRLWRRLLNKQKSDLRLKGLITLDHDLFFKVLEKVSASGGAAQRPTVFVHGYNTSFEGAVLRAAQFGHDLGIAQGIGLFSWPSKGAEFGYSSDEATVDRNKYALSEFLQSFVTAFPEQGVNVVAHSMGCRCLLGAIEVLALSGNEAVNAIHQVVFAAADVDAAMMPHQGRHAIDSADRTTSYVGDRDQALKLSRWLHGYDRVGLVPPAFTMSGLDTVLVNDADLGPFAHGYIGRSRAVLGDIHALLTSNTGPAGRFSVREHSVDGTQIWKLAD